MPAIMTTKGNCTPCGFCTVGCSLQIVATELVNLMRVNTRSEGQQSYKIVFFLQVLLANALIKATNIFTQPKYPFPHLFSQKKQSFWCQGAQFFTHCSSDTGIAYRFRIWWAVKYQGELELINISYFKSLVPSIILFLSLLLIC